MDLQQRPYLTQAGSRLLPKEGPRSLFQEAWWLEAAAPGRIEQVEVFWDAVRVASLSYVFRERFGTIRSVTMPPYTRTLGPVLSLPQAKPAKHALNLQRVLRELRAKLPPHDLFEQHLDPADETPLAFALAGFSVGQHFTFRVSSGIDLDALLSDVEPGTRRLIRAGRRNLIMVEHRDIGRFLRLARRDRPAEETIHDFDTLCRVVEACFSRGQGTFLTVVDEGGRDLAAVFLVWDGQVAYYLVPIRDRDSSGGGANAFLIWSAMRFALDRGLSFDFDSYGSVGTARFMTSFGIPPVARHVVTYRSLRLRCINLARAALHRGSRLSPDMYSPICSKNARLSWRDLRLRGPASRDGAE